MPALPFPSSRRARIALASAGLLVAVPAIAIVMLINADWNRAKPWLSARASAALGRPLAIDGDLTLAWRQSAAAEKPGGWRSYMPWPHFQARAVRMGNPAGISADPAHPHSASVSQLNFSLDPLALLGKKIVIPELRFNQPQLRLLRGKDGNNNWTFEKQNPDSPWRVELQSVVFSKGTVYLSDAVTDSSMRADVDTITDARYGIAWTLAGTYRGAPVKGSGKAGGVLSLQQQGTPFPLQAEMHAGGTMLAIDGTLTRPTRLAALDVLLTISGASMAQLYPLTGVLLPETPPFSAQGRLTGVLKRGGGDWVYDRFSGKVGSSDISGKATYSERKPRNVLTGNVHSKLLHLNDLGPLVGADNRASKVQRGAQLNQPAGRVLPVETFRTERWTSLEADVRYTADKITRDANLPISQVDTHIVLKDSVLSLAPLNFNIAGGTLVSQIRMDGSGKTAPGRIAAELKASARRMQIRQLFPRLAQLQASVGQINGDAALSATGNSVASLLGNANGEVKALINGGSISKLLLEEMGLNLGSVVLAKLSGDKQVRLNCLAADFGVTHGLMRTRQFIVDTDDAALHIDGTINLDNEQLDLTLHPDSKGVRIFSLRAPLYVKGTFSDPDLSVDKGVLALRAGGALALAAVAPFAGLLPLVNAGPGEQSECAVLLNQAGRKPVAPKPGKAGARAAPRPKTGERAVPR